MTFPDLMKEVVAPFLSIILIVMEAAKKFGWFGNAKYNYGIKKVFLASIAVILMLYIIVGNDIRRKEISDIKQCVKRILLTANGPQLKTEEQMDWLIYSYRIDKDNYAIAKLEMIKDGELKVEPYFMYCDKLKKNYDINLLFLSSKETGIPK